MPNEPVPAELQKLRNLSAQIQKLLRDADVGGIVNLQGKEFAEFAIIIDPSWSMLRWEQTDQGAGIRFRCKFKTGTPEEKEMGRLTVGLIHGLLAVLEQNHDQMDRLRRLLTEKLGSYSTITPIPPAA